MHNGTSKQKRVGSFSATSDLACIFDAIPAPTILLDSSGTIVATNRSWIEFGSANGANPLSISVGTNYLTVCEAATGPCQLDAVVVSAGIRSVLNKEVTQFRQRYECSSPTEKRWFEVTASATERANGEAAALVSYQDITALHQATSQLQVSNERWELALKANEDGIWDWNLDTNEVFFSDRWKEMLGYEPHEISNHLEEWRKRVHPDELEAVYAAIKSHLHGETAVYMMEHRVLHKDGQYRARLKRSTSGI